MRWGFKYSPVIWWLQHSVNAEKEPWDSQSSQNEPNYNLWFSLRLSSLNSWGFAWAKLKQGARGANLIKKQLSLPQSWKGQLATLAVCADVCQQEPTAPIYKSAKEYWKLVGSSKKRIEKVWTRKEDWALKEKRATSQEGLQNKH